MTTNDDARVTIEDVVVLNRSTAARTAGFARWAGTALLMLGTIGVAAFIWLAVRQEQELEDAGFSTVGPVEEEVTWVDRVDVLVNPVIYLLWAALVLAAGVALRLLADAVVAGTGGSLSGYEVGDTVTGIDEPAD